jgi:hypothetical protein
LSHAPSPPSSPKAHTCRRARAISGGIKSCRDSRPLPPTALLLLLLPRLGNSRPFLPGTQGAEDFLLLLLLLGCVDCCCALFISQGAMGEGL